MSNKDNIYNMEFSMSDGCTRCPKDILDLAINRYGEETVYKEMLKAKSGCFHTRQHTRNAEFLELDCFYLTGLKVRSSFVCVMRNEKRTHTTGGRINK